MLITLSRQLCLLGWLVAFLLAPKKVLAQDLVQGISVSPAFTQVTLDGTKPFQEVSFTLANSTSQTITLALKPIDLKPGNNGQINLYRSLQGVYPHHLASYLSLETEQLVLEPNSNKDIRVRVTDDQSVTAGGHYGAILASVIDSSGQNQAVLPGVSPLVIVRKTILGESIDFTFRLLASVKKISFSLPSSIPLSFTNTGTVHLVPKGVVELTDISGRVVRRGYINEDSVFLFPQTSREISVSLNSLRRSSPLMWYQLEARSEAEGITQNQSKQFLYLSPLLLIVLVLSGLISYLIKLKFQKGR